MDETERLSFIQIAAIYIGTVVGAGFASGQEVLQFFAFFGARGVAGLVLSVLMFASFGTIVMLIGHRLKATSYKPVIMEVGGPYVGRLIDYVITFFLFGAVVAMVAGAGATFEQEFGLPAIWGVGLMAVATVVTVLLGIGGVLSAISFVVPFLLIAVIAVSAFALLTAPIAIEWSVPQAAPVPRWWLSGIAYGSYNLLLATSVLAPMGRLASRRALTVGAILGALGLGIGALFVLLAILTQVPDIANVEVPMIVVAASWSPLAPLVYSIVLLAEVYTTAVGSLYGFIVRFVKEGSSLFSPLTVIAGLLAFVAGQLGFSTIVKTVYPAAGYAGFVFLIGLVFYVARRP